MGEFIVSGSDATPVLESAETSFDDVTLLVGLLVVADFRVAVGFARDDRPDALFVEKGSDRVGVVAFVGNQLFDAGKEADAFLGYRAISGVARREDEGPRPTEFVDDSVDFAVAAALRDPDRLIISPPFPPLAQRWILTWLESNAACSGGWSGLATDSKISCQTPRALQRAKRL